MTTAFPREKQVTDFISNFNSSFNILSAVENIGHRGSRRKLAFPPRTSAALVRDKEKSSVVVPRKRQNPRWAYCKYIMLFLFILKNEDNFHVSILWWQTLRIIVSLWGDINSCILEVIHALETVSTCSRCYMPYKCLNIV